MGLYSVDRVQLVKSKDGEGNALKAFATLKIADAFVVKNLRIIEGSNGLFVSMPQEKYTDKNDEVKYVDTAFPLTKEHRDEINAIVIKAYEAAVGKA